MNPLLVLLILYRYWRRRLHRYHLRTQRPSVRRALRIEIPPQPRSQFIDQTRQASTDYMRSLGRR